MLEVERILKGAWVTAKPWRIKCVRIDGGTEYEGSGVLFLTHLKL